jgi:hypothetical protein
MAETQVTGSQSTCIHPILGCLLIAEKDILGEGKWLAINTLQKEFLDICYEVAKGDVARLPELESIASWDVSVINKFLSDKGFDIQLDPIDKNTFAVASVLKVIVQWVEKGQRIKLSHGDGGGRKSDGVKLEDEKCGYFVSQHHNHPIAMLSTKSHDQVYLTICDEPMDGLELLKHVEKIRESMTITNQFDGVEFPMIDYNEQIDISWLIGMLFDGKDPWKITQALQQTKLKMNEVGAKVESAVAMCMLKCCSFEPVKPPLVINKPFLIWFERNGIKLPYFAGYMSESDWKDPGSID